MTTTDELRQVIATQADLTESLARVLLEQQQAIVHLRADELASLVEQSEGLVQPIRALEGERVRLTRELVSSSTGGAASEANGTTADDVVKLLDDGDGARVVSAIRRLRIASENVLTIARTNRPLLEHSQLFIKQTLRAATGDFTMNLVDKKV